MVLDIRFDNCFFFVLEKVCQGIEAIWKELLQDQEGTAFTQRNGKGFCVFFSPKTCSNNFTIIACSFHLNVLFSTYRASL